MNHTFCALTSLLLISGCEGTYALSGPVEKPELSIGYFQSHQGNTQYIPIRDLLGNDYTITRQNDHNMLLGVGILRQGFEKNNIRFSYGLRAQYLAKTTVQGQVIQERMFPNLAYEYQVTHLPIYATGKLTLKHPSKNAALTLDAGVGPNILATQNYRDYSIDGGVTLPDNAFLRHRTTTLSASAGIGIQFTPFAQANPIELGYRFFYLGQGALKPRTDQILSSLKTGNIYANALVCTLTL